MIQGPFSMEQLADAFAIERNQCLSFRRCIQLSQSRALASKEQYIALCTAAGIAMAILLFFYDSSYRNSQPTNIFCILLIGVTIWLKVRNVAAYKKMVMQ